jgi:hypothetical protein
MRLREELTDADLDELRLPGFVRKRPPERPGFLTVEYGELVILIHPAPTVIVCVACHIAVASADDAPDAIVRQQRGHTCPPSPLRPDPADAPPPPLRPPGPCNAHAAWPTHRFRCQVTGCPGHEDRSDRKD